MKITKKHIIPTFVMLGIIMVGLISSSAVSAQETNDYPSIVRKIAEKFNLNVSEVQEVFDEERENHKADMYAHLVEKLDSMIADGKITVEQKEAIIKKHEEIENKMLDIRDLAPEERRSEMEKFRAELKTWAEESGIEFPVFMMRGSHKGKFMKEL